MEKQGLDGQGPQEGAGTVAMEKMLEAAYRMGMRDGIAAYAIWKDGQMVVGCMEKPAREVLADLGKVYSYNPPTEAEILSALAQGEGSKS